MTLRSTVTVSKCDVMMLAALALMTGSLHAQSIETSAQATRVVKTAHLKVIHDGNTQLIAGRLYRIPLEGDQKHIAYVDKKGELDDPYRCERGDRLFASPKGSLYTGENESKPCKDGVEFVYQRTLLVVLEPISPSRETDFTNFLQAYSDMSHLYTTAAATSAGSGRFHYRRKARASETAVLVATAFALGDTHLDRLVTRDPLQDYKLVLSEAGVQTIKKIQRDNHLRVTGKLDFPTLGFVGSWGPPNALRSPSGDYLALPRGWLNDEVLRQAPNKSSSLIQLQSEFK